MDAFRIDDLWEREAYTDSGQHLGRIEAVGMGRDRVPRRVGLHCEGDGSMLRFFRLAGARVAGGRVILAAKPSLDVLPGGAC